MIVNLLEFLQAGTIVNVGKEVQEITRQLSTDSADTRNELQAVNLFVETTQYFGSLRGLPENPAKVIPLVENFFQAKKEGKETHQVARFWKSYQSKDPPQAAAISTEVSKKKRDFEETQITPSKEAIVVWTQEQQEKTLPTKEDLEFEGGMDVD